MGRTQVFASLCDLAFAGQNVAQNQQGVLYGCNILLIRRVGGWTDACKSLAGTEFD